MKARWVIEEVGGSQDGRPFASLSQLIHKTAAKKIARKISTLLERRMGLREVVKNPTLVHHGYANRAAFHVTTEVGHQTQPVADLYVQDESWAKRVAQALAQIIAHPVTVLDNRTRAGRSPGPNLYTHRRVSGPKPNPSGDPSVGEIWTTKKGGRCQIKAVLPPPPAAMRRVQVLHMESGDREWIDRDDFFASYSLKAQAPPRRAPNPKGRKANPEPIAYGQTIGRDWVQEWYETSSGHAAIRARQLRKAGFRVSVDSSSQVTPLGRMRMTLVDARGDVDNLPPVRVERMSNPKREPSRIRERGTRVTAAGSPDERIAAIRQIVQEKQYAKVDGTMIDLFSASAILAVYDALNDANKTKFASFPAGQMGIIAFKLLKKNPRPKVLPASFMRGWRRAWAACLSGRTRNPRGSKSAKYQDGEHDGMITALEGLPIPPFILKATDDYSRGFKAAYKRTGQGPARNPRGRKLSVPEQHQLKIARQTLRMRPEFARIMGGPSIEEAREIIHRLTGEWPKENPKKPQGGVWAHVAHGGKSGRAWVESVNTFKGTALVRFDPGVGMRSRAYSVPLSAVDWESSAGGGWMRRAGKNPAKREIPPGKVLLAEYGSFPPEDRAQVETVAEGWSPKVRSQVKLVTVTPGWEMAGSVARWTNGYNAVWWWEASGSRHGQQYRDLEAARRHFERLVGSAANPRRRATPRGRKPQRNPSSGEARATQAFRDWHELEPGRVTRMHGPNRRIPKHLAALGEVVKIVYRSKKWGGKPVLYEHTTKRPRPVLATDRMGGDVHIVGGRMHPTPDGLVN